MRSKAKSKWYGVRTLYESVLSKQKAVTQKMGKAWEFEERVVLFRAANFSEAIRSGEAEARKYQSKYKNPYNEKVSIKYLEVADAFELFDPPDSGKEIYSMTQVFDKNINRKKYIDQKFGKTMSKENEKRLRQRFLNAEFARGTKKSRGI